MAFPFMIRERNWRKVAEAVCSASCELIYGNFDCDIDFSYIEYKIVTPYHDSYIGKGAILYMVDHAQNIVSKYIDRFRCFSLYEHPEDNIFKSISR